jgi:uroporphyrin-3 C-methyltransferase
VSDQQDKNIEQLAQETAASGESMKAKEPAEDASDAAPVAPVSAPPPAAKASSAPGWIALLLALLVGGGLGWTFLQQQRLDAEIGQRLQAVEAAAEQPSDLDALGQSLQGQLNTAIGQVQAETGTLGESARQLSQTVEALQMQMVEQRAELARYSANDRDAWLLAEAQYLLRMANQRLLMAGDVAAAQALLGSADSILLGLDDVRLHDVRAAVAVDLAAVRAVPRLDVEGVYLRLAALAEQAGDLVIFQLPEQAEQIPPAPAEDWQGRFKQGYQAALSKLSSYIIIRRRDVPVQALMDPQWEGLVRQNLRMLLEQAQVALLSGNQVLYRESLERAQHWVGQFYASDEAAARAMSRELTQLADISIATSLPDISTSVQALDAFMKRRLQQGAE